MDIFSQQIFSDFREHYDQAAGSWGRWADTLAEQQDKVNLALLDAAGVGSGMKVLDLASGVGEPAVTAARLVGEAGIVTATDISVPMVQALTDRMARIGLTQVRCEVADMEALPYTSRHFDAVVCRYGLMYAADPARVIAEAARVLKPGGRLAFMVWGPEANNTLLFHGLRAANRHWGNPLEEAGIRLVIRFAEADSIAALMRSAGLASIHEKELVFEPRIRLGTPFWLPLLEMNATHVWQGLTSEQRRQTSEVVAAAYEQYREGDHWVLSTHIRVASAAVPRSS